MKKINGTFSPEAKKQKTTVYRCLHMNRKCLPASIFLWCRLCILLKKSQRIRLFFQQIAAGVPVLVPSGSARVWKGAGTQPFDLFHLQPLCCLVEGERQVSHSRNTGISPMEHVVCLLSDSTN